MPHENAAQARPQSLVRMPRSESSAIQGYSCLLHGLELNARSAVRLSIETCVGVTWNGGVYFTHDFSRLRASREARGACLWAKGQAFCPTINIETSQFVTM